MKKVSLAALVAALTLPTFASADVVTGGCPKAFQGLHLGGNLGVAVGSGQNKWQRRQDNVTRPDIEDTARLGPRGVDGGVNVGYTYRFTNCSLNNFIVGLEFVANWSNAQAEHRAIDNTNVNAVQIRQRVSLRNSLQLRGNFGYVINNLVAPKFIVGWDSSRWAQRAVFNDELIPIETLNKTKYHEGVLLGLGVDVLATRHFIVGFETTATFAGRKTTNKRLNQAFSPGEFHRNAWKPEVYLKGAIVAKFIY